MTHVPNDKKKIKKSTKKKNFRTITQIKNEGKKKKMLLDITFIKSRI